MIKERIKALIGEYYEYLLLPFGLILFLLAWHIAATLYEPYILPSPWEVWLRWREFAVSQILLQHFAVTAGESLSGFLLGAVLALPFGYFLARHPFLERFFTPYIVGIQAVPIVALAPLLVIWFGFGISSKILVAALVAFFPILTNSTVGFRGTDRRLRELMAIMGATSRQILLKLEIPSALPVIFGGLKMGITLSVIGAVVGEFSGAGRGLGYLVNLARGRFDTALIFIALIILAVLGITFYLLMSFLEYLAMPWKHAKRTK